MWVSRSQSGQSNKENIHIYFLPQTSGGRKEVSKMASKRITMTTTTSKPKQEK